MGVILYIKSNFFYESLYGGAIFLARWQWIDATSHNQLRVYAPCGSS